MRFFIGYSGWAAGQLENELKENFWIVTEIDNEMIFNIPTQKTWETALNKMDQRYKLWTTYPDDPNLN